jgi:hypothetical protein
MTTAATSLLGLALPVTGELSGTWGDTVNNSITSLLDSAIAGTTTLSTDGDVTLTTTTLATNQARQAILLCSGARTAIRNITAPAQSKIYTIINATTGGYAVVIRGAGPTTGVTVPAGQTAQVAWNGSDFVDASNYVGGNLKVNGNLSVTGTSTLTGAITSNLIFTDNTYDIGASGATRPRNLYLSGNEVLAGSLTLSGGTATGVPYLNASKVLTTGSDIVYDSSGNFLIGGVTGTGAKFEVASAQGNGIRIKGTGVTASNGPVLLFNNQNNSASYVDLGYIQLQLTGGAAGSESGDMAFGTKASSGSVATKLTLTSAGNLNLAAGNLSISNSGISNSAGGYTMTMYGSSTTAAAKLSLTQVWNGTLYPANIISLSDPTAGGASSAMAFQTSVYNGSGVTTAEAMRINYQQFVGIGTTTPSQKLSVSGGTIRNDLGATGTSMILTGTGSNLQFAHNSSNYATIYNSGGGILLQSNSSVNFGVIQQNSNSSNKSVRWVITQGDGGTNSVQVYWNNSYGSAQAGGCLGAYDQSGNYAAPGTSIGGSSNWAIYGFVSYTT